MSHVAPRVAERLSGSVSVQFEHHGNTKNISKLRKSSWMTDCTKRFNNKSHRSFIKVPKAKEKRRKWIAAINWNPGTEM